MNVETIAQAKPGWNKDKKSILSAPRLTMTVYDSDHCITGLPYKFTACAAARLDGIQARKAKKMRDGKNKINDCFAWGANRRAAAAAAASSRNNDGWHYAHPFVV